MTAPGDGFGECGHDDQGKPPPASGGAPEQPEAPWEPPASAPAPEYPPPAYPPPGYPTDYHPGYAAQYPPPPPGYGPPPGYDQPPGYGAPPYEPGPPQFGGSPAGYGPPHYPGGYYSAPDYRVYGPPMQPGTNVLAIASLISSFVGVLCCLGSIAGIVMGAIALNQIKQTRQEGFGLAIAGIIIGVATLVVSLIVAIFAMHSR